MKKLFRRSKGKEEILAPEEKIIGITEAVCPYCSKPLDKFPGKKKKCPHCTQFIYVRTRPSDRAKILIREDQIEKVEELWAIENGVHEEYLAARQEFENKRQDLQAKWKQRPSDNDVQWALCNEQLINPEIIRNPNLYRGIRFQMAEILRKEKRFPEALDTFLEIIFRDVNNAIQDNIFNKETPIWDGILGRTLTLIEKCEYDREQVKAKFFEINSLIYSAQKKFFVLDPQKAWEVISNYLFSYMK